MNNILNYPVYIFFGILPSFLWLQFYLRRDVRPEPKLMILKIFFYGMLFTIPAVFLEMAIFGKIQTLNFSPYVISILNFFFGVALVEEFLKFLVIQLKVLNNPEFDEPIDAMIYMIISALGFAAAENLLILFPLVKPIFLGKIFEISLLRFLGATFLHALASAIVGFFIGLSFFEKKKRGGLITEGLTLAILLHGFYNFSIIEMEKGTNLLIPFFLLLTSAIFVSFGFKKLKKLAKVHQR
jgi:RsiW-degrading membrane proteinase PrsW (M82 family)